MNPVSDALAAAAPAVATVNPIAGAFTGLASWLADIGDRLVRGIIDDKQAEAEYRQHDAEFTAELAAARSTVAASRAVEDAARAKLPHETPAAPLSGTSAGAAPVAVGSSAAAGPGPSGTE